ncbi:MAG TPA: response regulator transcription factor [Ferruginibacter sp.]|nr:response regulator transcription factor [Ferruginibacter sp.]
MTSLYMPIRIVLADDHEIFRDGFAGLFKKQTEIQLIGEASDGRELIALTEKLKPDVILTDIKMPNMDGIEATKILTQKFPGICVIALSMFNDDNLVIDMMEAGAKGYLLKNAHKTEIIEAIKTVYRQGMYYCKQTSDKLIKMLAKSKFNLHKEPVRPTFTVKEIEIIRLICEQRSNKEISNQLCLSIRTIEGYRKTIQEKMKVKTLAGIAIYAIRNNIYQI